MRANHASVIGSGANGLVAAIELAEAGLEVDVYEAQEQPGGAARTMELTLPGFKHDFGSAVHPLAVGSPVLSKFPWSDFGVRWIYGGAEVAHPLDDGTAVLLHRDLNLLSRDLGVDGEAWTRAVGDVAERWAEFARDALAPPVRFPKSPWLMAKFCARGLLSANQFVQRFKDQRTRAMFAGLAAHSAMGFHEPLSASIGLVLGASGHAVGWPIPEGGAQAITNALLKRLQQLGGRLHCGHRVESLDEVLRDGSITMCDVTPRQLLELAAKRMTSSYASKLERFAYGPAAFKMDFALREPIPWRAASCRDAITVHLGGSFEEIAKSEDEVHRGRVAQRPYVLVAQPTLFDRTRAPEGKHIAWAYCHVPHGCTVDVSRAVEDQLERFAPGFRDCVIAKRKSGPSQLERLDENLVGGDINGGRMNMRQFLSRPTLDPYRTSMPGVYLCSASTPPGGGVHGMCGFNAAQIALQDRVFKP